ncbi:MAG TPA: ABC transporter permease [Clostridia bacterium]|nr:ABC transporter permease [Clostridia bacterium]
MNLIFGLAENILQTGCIYGIMAMGVYITYKILDFPDLSVDGTFPLGACVAAALITAGVDPYIACAAAFLCGAAAGAVTGLMHVKLKITDLLSGIIMMTGLITVNLAATGGSSILPFYNMPTIFNSGLVTLLPAAIYEHRTVLISVLIALIVKLMLDWFLKTKRGLLLRAAGDNARYVTYLGKDQGRMKILGLAIGNGCTALSGCIYAQQAESASSGSGAGMVVLALASVIIGTNLFRRVRFMKATTMAVLGAVLYQACLTVAMQLRLPTNYLKLLMAALLVAALLSNRLAKKGGAADVTER